MSFSLYIEGIVRIHLQDIQTITFGIVVSVNVNVLPEGGQRSVAVEQGVVLLLYTGGYLHYSYNGYFGLKVILRDRSGELFPLSWRYKGLTFCHLTFSFDLRPCHLRCLGDG